MSYGLKYWNEFGNYYSEKIRVEILGENFTGSAEEIQTSTTPLVISYPGDETNPFNPIVGSQAKFQMLSKTDFKFINLHNSDSRAHRLDVYKNEVLDWSGWILPDLFSEPYVAAPYFVEVTARCGLGELKEMKVPEVLTESTQPRLIDIFSNVLGSIDTKLDFNDCINVYSNLTDSISDSPLFETRINLIAYEGKNWYEAISDILLPFGARIYQMSGEWWAVRIKETAKEMNVRRWLYTGAGYIENVIDTAKSTSFLIGRPESSQIINNGPNLDINPAWKEFSWLQDLGLKDNLLLNGDFSKWDEIFNTAYIQSWQVFGTPDLLGGGSIFGNMLNRGIDSNGEFYGQFRSTYKNGANYIKQEVTNLVKSVDQILRFKIVYDSMWFSTGAPSGQLDEFFLKIENKGASSKYLAINDSTNESYWTNTNTLINIKNVDQTLDFGTDWRDLDIDAPGLELDGSLIISIYAARFGVLKLKSVVATFVDKNGVPYPEEQRTTIDVNQKNIYTPKDIEIVSGDLLDVTNNKAIYNNGFRNAAGIATKEWHERGSALKKPILKLIGDDYKSIFSKPQFKLSLPILSQNIKFDSSIVDYQILPKKYICVNADIDYYNSIFSGIFVEFDKWEGARWILETGYWNDSGIWIDSDKWIDGDNETVTYNIGRSYSAGDKVLISEIGIGDLVYSLPGIGLLKDEFNNLITWPSFIPTESTYFVIPDNFSGIRTTSFEIVKIGNIYKRFILNLDI